LLSSIRLFNKTVRFHTFFKQSVELTHNVAVMSAIPRVLYTKFHIELM
jgi:hypothetical protein